VSFKKLELNHVRKNMIAQIDSLSFELALFIMDVP